MQDNYNFNNVNKNIFLILLFLLKYLHWFYFNFRKFLITKHMKNQERKLIN